MKMRTKISKSPNIKILLVVLTVVLMIMLVPVMAFAEGDAEKDDDKSGNGQESAGIGTADLNSDLDSDLSVFELSPTGSEAHASNYESPPPVSSTSEAQPPSPDKSVLDQDPVEIPAPGPGDGDSMVPGLPAHEGSPDNAENDLSIDDPLYAASEPGENGGGANSYTVTRNDTGELVFGTEHQFSLTFVEVGYRNLYIIKITLPDSFDYTENSLNWIPEHSTRNWTGSVVNQVITLSAVTPNDRLPFTAWGTDDSITVDFKATPTAVGNFELATSVWSIVSYTHSHDSWGTTVNHGTGVIAHGNLFMMPWHIHHFNPAWGQLPMNFIIPGKMSGVTIEKAPNTRSGLDPRVTVNKADAYVGFGIDFDFPAVLTVAPEIGLGRYLVLRPEELGILPLVTILFVREGTGEDLNAVVALYEEFLQEFNENLELLDDREYARMFVDLYVARAAINAVEARLHAEAGEEFDLEAVVEAYKAALAAIKRYGDLLDDADLEIANDVMAAVAELIEQLSGQS